MMNTKDLILEAIKMPHYAEWIELKTNFWNPKEIGEYISALSNSAAIYGKTNGIMIWGVDDENHQIVGTNINYQQNINIYFVLI